MFSHGPLGEGGGRASVAARGSSSSPQAVAEAIDGSGVLIAEAGTGTGKTFAYLVPALLSGGKVIVSTGTKTLQDQLFHRDLPRVRARARRAGDRAAQGPRQLRVPPPPRARGAGGRFAVARGGRAPAQDPRFARDAR